MSDQETDLHKKASKQSKINKPLQRPEVSSPMDTFNNAMRKILSVPKKNIDKK